jgi:phosphoglucomutase
MAALMDALRNNPPAQFGGVDVKLIGDYLKETFTEGGKVTPTGLPRANVLYYRLVNGDVIVARPSGTEPKIKFYYMLEAENRPAAEAKLKSYQETLDKLAK